MKHKVQGIIFDMDNTLLRSHIDFQAMRADTYAYLTAQGLISPDLPIEDHTTSTLINTAKKSGGITPAQQQALWAIPAKHEYAGMRGAKLEPGVQTLLAELTGQYRLAIVTNNALEAALLALQENDIWHAFDYVVGREQMQQMKPSPAGFQAVLEHFPELPSSSWISVGDAWIDGIASAAAGVPFIAYRGDRERLLQKGVHPIANVAHIHEIKAYI